MNKTEPIIRLERATKIMDGKAILDGVDLAIQPRRTTVVIGPSGCGKTVLLKHMVGLLRPDRGKVFFKRHEISAMTERRLVAVRRRIGFLFQGGALFDSMSVAENVCFPLVEHEIGTEQERAARCEEVLALVGLHGQQNKFPEELSGGQKKRVALARAISLRPEVILYDEPTTGLDPIRADLINELILKLQETLGNTAVVVTHDMSSARKVGDRIVMLYGGRFIADTTPQRLDHVRNDVVVRFVEGRASLEELAELDANRLGELPSQADDGNTTENAK